MMYLDKDTTGLILHETFVDEVGNRVDVVLYRSIEGEFLDVRLWQALRMSGAHGALDVIKAGLKGALGENRHGEEE